jgi:predicted nucleic acid-binding protein
LELGKLDILTKLFSEIYIPQAVHNEISRWSKPHSQSLKMFGKIRISKRLYHSAVKMAGESFE